MYNIVKYFFAPKLFKHKRILYGGIVENFNNLKWEIAYWMRNEQNLHILAKKQSTINISISRELNENNNSFTQITNLCRK